MDHLSIHADDADHADDDNDNDNTDDKADGTGKDDHDVDHANEYDDNGNTHDIANATDNDDNDPTDATDDCHHDDTIMITIKMQIMMLSICTCGKCICHVYMMLIIF